jgi:hypothetical protein
MGTMEPVPVEEISEDSLADHAPRVRALVIRRLEGLFELTQTQIHLAEEKGRPVDPRWAELGLRITREVSAQYRLSKATGAVDDPDTWAVDDPDTLPVPLDVINEQLAELEAKLSGPSVPGDS